MFNFLDINYMIPKKKKIYFLEFINLMILRNMFWEFLFFRIYWFNDKGYIYWDPLFS